MKKNLKSKILLCVLAGGVLAANTVMAAEYTETISGIGDTSYSAIKEDRGNNEYIYNFSNGDKITLTNERYGIQLNENVNIDINNDISLSVTSIDSQEVTGIYNLGTLTVDDIAITVQANAKDNSTAMVKSEGIHESKYFYGGDSLKANYVNIISTATGNESSTDIKAYGINSEYQSTIDIERADIKAKVSTQKNAAYAYGVYASGGGTVTIGDNAKITASGTGNDGNSVFVYGIATGNAGTINLGTVDIVAECIGTNSGQLMGINANAGTVNMAGGSIKLNPNSENRYGLYAVYATNGGSVNINEDKQNALKINGDVFSNAQNGGINLNFTTKDSVLNGSVDLNNQNTSINLHFSQGAVWNNGDGYLKNIKSTVSSLSLDNGTVNQKSANKLTINNYSGNGNINFEADSVAIDGVADFDGVGDVTIKNAEKDSFVKLGITNESINTLDIAKTEENLNAIANKLYYDANDRNLNGKVVIKEGLITPEASGDLLFDADDRGYVTNITGGNSTTETMYAMKNLAATAIVAWRQEDSTLSQRLGELRDSADGQGIWVRMSRGEFEYDGEYKNQYNFFQMGYDWAADDWHYGAAISHNDGQTTYTYGDGENRSTSLSLYGTWLGDKGHYADIVLKQGCLSNDFDIYTSAGHTSGDYDAWGTSLSGEYGKKIALEDDWYVTPQAQLTLMRIGGGEYTTNNGINVHQDTLHSAVGRLGFELGKKINDKGSVYAKASLLHDFAGNAETYLSYNGLANSYSQDISDTWCEAGIGFNYKTSDNSYVYADVVKTFGGDVETPWQWNAGMRWSF